MKTNHQDSRHLSLTEQNTQSLLKLNDIFCSASTSFLFRVRVCSCFGLRTTSVWHKFCHLHSLPSPPLWTGGVANGSSGEVSVHGLQAVQLYVVCWTGQNALQVLKREWHRSNTLSMRVSKLAFYAQSTITVIPGRCKHENVGKILEMSLLEQPCPSNVKNTHRLKLLRDKCCSMLHYRFCSLLSF